jgi:hypothetical protein
MNTKGYSLYCRKKIAQNSFRFVPRILNKTIGKNDVQATCNYHNWSIITFKLFLEKLLGLITFLAWWHFH